MPRTGEALGSGLGDSKSKLLRLWLDVFAGGTLRLRILPFGKFSDRSWALFSNAKNRGHSSADLGERNLVLPLDPQSQTASGEVIEIGLLGPQTPEDVTWEWLAGWVEEADAIDAKKLRLVWTALPQVTIESTAPLSSITVSGATRYNNCQEIEEFQHRARLRYTITADGTTRYVKWFAGNKLVASGSRTGNGIVALSEENASGLSGACVLAYSGDTDSFFDLKWAGSYQIYYDNDPIVWSSTPNDTVTDLGVDSFTWLSPTIASGAVHFGVRAISDDGVLELVPNEAPNSPLTINDYPKPPTDLYATGNAAALVIHWTQSLTGGAKYKVYASLVDEPVNLTQWSSPVPLSTAVGATSKTLAPVLNWTPQDKTDLWNTFSTACYTWRTTVNALLSIGARLTYAASLEAAKITLINAVKTLGNGIDRDFSNFIQPINLLHKTLSNKSTASVDVSDADWLVLMTPVHEGVLDSMSYFYDGRKGNFLMPDGSIPLASVASTSDYSIWDYCTPLVENRIVRVIVRATSLAGVQETTDYVLEVELDSNGDVVLPRPNTPSIESITSSGRTITVNTLWQEEDSAADAVTIQLWVVAVGVAPNPAIPSATAALVEGLGGTYRSSPYKLVGSDGYYDLYIAALSADGGQSLLVGPKTRWISNADPYEAQGLEGKIIRSI